MNLASDEGARSPAAVLPGPSPAAGSVPAVWDSGARTYDSARRLDPVYSSCIAQTIHQVNRGTTRCLDAGCGTGMTTTALADRCATIVAVDYSLESLKVLKNKGLANVLVVQADLRALPFAQAVFDACVCGNTLQHLKPTGPQQHAVEELSRVARSGGAVSISVHHYSNKKRKAGWTKEGKPGQPGIDYIFRFSRDDLKALMPGARISSAGFYGLPRVPVIGARVQNMMALLFGRIAARLGYGHMLIATSQKR